MTVPVAIIDGQGSGIAATVNIEGALEVVVHSHPASTDRITTIPSRKFFTDNGLVTGNSDMRVNGSINPQSFFIEALENTDGFVKTISIVIADQSATLNKFGNLAALTNGVEFSYVSDEFGTVVIADALKTNFDFVRMSLGSPAFGDGTAAFRANNVSGNSEAYIPVINMAILFGMPFGLRLRAGTKDRIVFTVKDDLTGVDQFDIIGYGIAII